LLELVGRRREIVKSIHGDLLVPAEIEAVLAAQPGVVAVAVCGLTAADGNEELVAFVELEPTLTDRESLWERLRGAVLAALGPHHLPARFVPVDTMPRGTNAKILKPALLEKYPLA
jgi:acyl-coenzyme A synthetase/AMP-(fatty) acid ligase